MRIIAERAKSALPDRNRTKIQVLKDLMDVDLVISEFSLTNLDNFQKPSRRYGWILSFWMENKQGIP